ncbi:MAG: IMPACT family member YigZ [Candidatus Erwinia impunctatus]|nr:IMPACT family member YigZ [Culicoides impunctatus]
MDAYDIPAQARYSVTEEIKKSRFITIVAHTHDISEAKAFVQQVKNEHPVARHHCWAWIAGAPDDSQAYGFSDDGEPSGTAGKPMLAQLLGSQVGEISVVVVRYFGGVLLGTGGLVKAYGGGVQQALRTLPRQKKIPMRNFTLHCSYGQHAEVERLMSHFQGVVHESEFAQQVSLHLALPYAQVAEFTQRLADFSRGTLSLVPDNPEKSVQ